MNARFPRVEGRQGWHLSCCSQVVTPPTPFRVNRAAAGCPLRFGFVEPARGDALMLRKTMLAAVLVVTALVLVPGVASAQQSISLNLGYFALRGLDARPTEDVLVQDLNYHIFDIKDFNNVTVGGEWLIPLNPLFEVGVGAGYFQKSVPSVYADLVADDGSEIQQTFKLRTVPITGIVRFLPTGRRSAVQPYIGAGIAVIAWRYSETGEFVDTSSNIFRGNFNESGTSVGPVVVGGIRFPLSTGFAFGGEIRYQRAEGSLNNDFNGTKIDLGGLTYQASFVFRF
jgi:opacity protein-like surface antigen